MATTYITATTAVAQTVAMNDTLLVTGKGLITSATDGITSTGDTAFVQVYGSVHGNGSGIVLESVNLIGYGYHNVKIAAAGIVTGSASDAIRLAGDYNKITNNGTIFSNDSASAGIQQNGDRAEIFNSGSISAYKGIKVSGDISTNTTEVWNSGEIISSFRAIEFVDQYLTLVNSGTIFGDTTAIQMFGANKIAHITNSGTIGSNSTALGFRGADDTVLNSGTINGTVDMSGGDDLLVNSGRMQGAIQMGSGNDTFDGRGGVVDGNVDGGADDDIFYVSDRVTKIIETVGNGTDIVYATVNYTLGDYFENLTLLEDAIRGIGNTENNTIFGNDADNRLRGRAGDDVIEGMGGNDDIRGQNGNDKLFGGEGDDIVKGNRGNDTLYGGAGDDLLKGGYGSDQYNFDFLNDGEDIITEFGGSSDTLVITGRVMSQLDFRRSGDVLVIESGGTPDRVLIDDFYMAGDTGRVEILETATGSKYLQTGLTGDATADIIVGFSGTQIIHGEDGDDILIGKGDKDRLYGGAGADRFDYDDLSDSGTTSTTMDTIYDFVSGTDKIDLFDIDADTTTAGNQNFTFIGAAAYSGTAGELRYQVIGGNTQIGVDVDGDMIDDFNILLAGNIAFGAGDFVL